MHRYYFAMLLGVVLTSVAQIFLKLGANKNRDNFIELYLNKWTITGYFLFFSVVYINTFALQKLPITVGIMFNPLIYLFVLVLAHFILKEKIRKNHIVGSLIIISGIIIFSIGNLLK